MWYISSLHRAAILRLVGFARKAQQLTTRPTDVGGRQARTKMKEYEDAVGCGSYSWQPSV